LGTGIVIDARKLGDGGIGVYLENLIDGLIELKNAGRINPALTLLLSHKQELALHSAPPADSNEAVAPNLWSRWRDDCTTVVEPAGKYSLSEFLLLALRQRKVLKQNAIFHSPHFTLPYFCPIPSVVTIHDLIHVSHPDSLLHSAITPRLVKSAMQRAAHIITVSEASKEALFRVAPNCNKPVSVIPNALRVGVSAKLSTAVSGVLAKHEVSSPYLLFVGPDRPHKGLCNLIRALAEVRKNSSELKDLNLVVVSKQFSAASQNLIRQLKLAENVKLLHVYDVDQLSALYSGAAGVVVPSLEEGFGLVALEAMACGAPLVCTPVKSLAEFCDEIAWFAESFEANSLAAVITKALTETREQQHRVLLGRERARRYSRARVAEQTIRAYEIAAESCGKSLQTSAEWGALKIATSGAQKFSEQIEGQG